MLKAKPFLLMLFLCGGFFLSCNTVYANSVIDIFNIYQRQMMKNTLMEEQKDVLQKGSDDIATYVGLETNVATGQKKLTDNTAYKCGNNEGFDSGYGCRDWALDGTNLLTTRQQLVKIHDILGDNYPLAAQDKDHYSLAVEYMKCLAGTTDKGTKKEKAEVAACKDIISWDYNPIMVQGLAKTGLFEYFFSPEMEYFIIQNDGQKEIISRPKGDVSQQNLSSVSDFVRKKMTYNVCDVRRASSAGVEKQAATAKRLALAQGYAMAVSGQRAGELFDKRATAYLHNIASLGSKYNPKTIRQDIHLLIAADAGIIHLLKYINGIQGLITELTALDNGLGGIKNYDGVDHLIGELQTQEELCK